VPGEIFDVIAAAAAAAAAAAVVVVVCRSGNGHEKARVLIQQGRTRVCVLERKGLSRIKLKTFR
jgi:hypothetical protein